VSNFQVACSCLQPFPCGAYQKVTDQDLSNRGSSGRGLRW
jgi:hypothetical protein